MAEICADIAQQVDLMNKGFAGCGNVKLFELHKKAIHHLPETVKRTTPTIAVWYKTHIECLMYSLRNILKYFRFKRCLVSPYD